MGLYARHTKTPVEKSLKEIEQILFRYGVRNMKYEQNRLGDKATLSFKVNARKVRFNMPLPTPTDDEIVYTPTAERERPKHLQKKFFNQAINQRWRTLALAIKARFARLDDKVISFDEEFLGNIVLANNKTLSEIYSSHVDSLTTNKGLARKLEVPFSKQPGLIPQAATN